MPTVRAFAAYMEPIRAPHAGIANRTAPLAQPRRATSSQPSKTRKAFTVEKTEGDELTMVLTPFHSCLFIPGELVLLQDMRGKSVKYYVVSADHARSTVVLRRVPFVGQLIRAIVAILAIVLPVAFAYLMLRK